MLCSACGTAALLIIFFVGLFVRDIYALRNVLLSVLPILLIASLFYADWQWLKMKVLEET